MDNFEMTKKIAELVLELDKVKAHNETLRLHNQRLVQKINYLNNPEISQMPVSFTIHNSKRPAKQRTQELMKRMHEIVESMELST